MFLATELATKLNILLATKNWWSQNVHDVVISDQTFSVAKYNICSYRISDQKVLVANFKF